MLPSTGAGLMVTGVTGAATTVGCAGVVGCSLGPSVVHASSVVPAARVATAAERNGSGLDRGELSVRLCKSSDLVFVFWRDRVGAGCRREVGWSGRVQRAGKSG